MTILSGDIKLLASKVMDDVPEGGGGPSGVVIPDGVSNAIFKDVSEVDRAMGAVHVRMLHAAVQTPDTDTYLGVNIGVSEPPQDPRQSIVVFDPGGTFATRDQALKRIQGYLNAGAAYPAFLFGNHLAGQDTVLLYQRSATLPGIGDTLVLRKNEGRTTQFEQYVRVIEVAVQQRTFEDDRGEYQRYVVTIRISDALLADFLGFNANRIDPTQADLTLSTKVMDTVVANSSRYYGVQPLTEAAGVGDFTFRAKSMFASLVPSAQVETPIADARTNQSSAALVAAGAALTTTLNALFTTAQSLYIGAGILPGSLSIVRDGVTVTDAGGRLVQPGGAQVGTIEYEAGIATLTGNVFGLSPGSHQITYTPAAAPQTIDESIGIQITAANRSTSYVLTIEPVPARGSTSVQYRAQGRWYTLRDDGSGAVRGADSSYGIASLNLITGSLVITLGALPDVGSALIVQYAQAQAVVASDGELLEADGRLFFPLNADGVASTARAAKALQRNGVTVRWKDGATNRSATDDGAGQLQGDATGPVDYPAGVVYISPKLLPAVGTIFELETQSRLLTPQTVAMAAGANGRRVGNLGATNIGPRTVTLTVPGFIRMVITKSSADPNNPTVETQDLPADQFRFVDDGAGNLGVQASGRTLSGVSGGIDYATGDFWITGSIAVSQTDARYLVSRIPIYSGSLTWAN